MIEKKTMVECVETMRDMVLRDSFAQSALNGMLSRANSSATGHPKTADGYSAAAYEFADAMLKARQQ